MSRIDMKHRFPRNLTALALMAVIGSYASTAAAAGDSEAGWQLAKRWCSGCHVVDAAGYGTDTAPAFATIARTRTDRRWVRTWLYSPHPPMPNLNLSRGEVDDVIAYLDTLAPR